MTKEEYEVAKRFASFHPNVSVHKYSDKLTDRDLKNLGHFVVGRMVAFEKENKL